MVGRTALSVDCGGSETSVVEHVFCHGMNMHDLREKLMGQGTAL
jgi:hypothetical protein